MRKLLAGLGVGAFALSTLALPKLWTDNKTENDRVERVAQSIDVVVVKSIHDADTINVLHENTPIKVRLACVDAPELAQKPLGQAALNRVKQVLPIGSTVQLVPLTKDRYDRVIADVRYKEQSLNVLLVREGLAVTYAQYFPSCPDLKASLIVAEQEARQQRVGIWEQRNPVMPWDFRRSLTKTNVENTAPTSTAIDKDCKDFKSRQEVTAYLKANNNDPYELDQNKNGVACESFTFN